MNNNELDKKYGLLTAISMVVGIVIGSGVFFKAEKVLTATNGNVPLGILSWIAGGLIMIFCARAFAILATTYNKSNGIVDYAEAMIGPNYGYMMAWFIATIYYPTLSSVLSWVAARYLGFLLGWHASGGETMLIACFFLIATFSVNALTPRLAGYFQVSATIIKVIPLLLMGAIGTIIGLTSPSIPSPTFNSLESPSIVTGFFTSVVATAFAYEGWIVATSINSELRNAKKNLPRALIFGSIFVVIIYVLYYIGLLNSVSNEVLLSDGENGVKAAFINLFGDLGGSLLYVFIIISCLGTLNGLMFGNTRSFYSFAIRNKGPFPSIFKSVDPKTNIPNNSAIIGLFLSILWLIYFYGSNITGHWFGVYCFDSSELPIVTTYAMYIPIFIMMLFKEKHLSFYKRYIIPVFAIISSFFMIVASFFSHGISTMYYLLTYTIIMLIGLFFEKNNDE